MLICSLYIFFLRRTHLRFKNIRL